MRKLYSFIQASTIFSFLMACCIIFIFFHKDVVPFLAEKYLKEFNIYYENIEGTLFGGIKIRNLKYNGLEAKEVEIKYNFFKLLRPTPRINYIYAKDTNIDLNSFLSQETSGGSMAINISKIKLKNTILIYNNQKYIFDFESSFFTMRDSIDMEKLKLSLKSEYADVELEGKLARNKLHAKGYATISKDIKENYLSFLTSVEKNIPFTIDLDSKKLYLSTALKSLSINKLEDLKLHAINTELFYNFSETTFKIKNDYKLNYQEYDLDIKQKIFYDLNETIWGDAIVNIENTPYQLPFDKFTLDIKKDLNISVANLKTDEYNINIKTKEFKDFEFIYDMSYIKGDGYLVLEDNYNFLEANIFPLKTLPIFDTLKLNENIPITIGLMQIEDSFTASATMQEETITAFYFNQLLHGFATIKSAEIWFNSDLDEKNMYAYTTVESLSNTLHKLQDKNFDIDAKAEIETIVDFKESLEIKTTLSLPWFSIDMKKSGFYDGSDAKLHFYYKDNQLELKEYELTFMDHYYYSKKSSKIMLKPNGDLKLKEFWVYDSLHANGYLKTSDGSGYFKIKTDDFVYTRDDANLTLKGFIEVKLDADTKQTITGEIVLIGGEISYQLQNDYTISDSDIIIIQDLIDEEEKANKQVNRYVHIDIKSENDINYKVENIDLKLSPEVFIHQEPYEELQLLGRVIINSGAVNVSDREFEFERSEVYFDGKTPINPILQLNLHHYTYDYIDIEVFITNTMNDPVVIFSSNPSMSQEDILSYLLFGGAASSVFDTSSNENDSSLNAMLLGAGVKEAINRSTFIKVDTLNIVTNEEGTFGYEIGARFNKNIRIVYKNDATSTIVFQYSINKNLRFDVDVKESGQGVSIIYVKDFAIP